MKYYGRKRLFLRCPECGARVQTTLRNGGWSVDCEYMSLFGFLEGKPVCKYDYWKWNPELQPTEREAIKQFKRISNDRQDN